MRRSKVTEADLYESLRVRGSVSSLADVKEARLERNGEISVIAAPEYVGCGAAGTRGWKGTVIACIWQAVGF